MSANPNTAGFPWMPAHSQVPVNKGDNARGSSSAVQNALSALWRSPVFGAAFLRVFRTLQAAGINVLPNHFYWPVPDLRRLERRDWSAHNIAIDLRVEGQARFAREMTKRYSEELHFPPGAVPDPAVYHRNNGFFETVDADIAYCMVRAHKPRRIVEIGGGYSTRVMAAAARTNARDGNACELTTIEPYPDRTLRCGFAGLSRLVASRVQDAPVELFESLGAGDILFIDSSHVVTVGSDVVYEFFEILPRLRAGVIVHLHDIFYPSDYPRDAVLKFLWFWSEQYLLQALLTSNAGFEVVWASSAMTLLCPEALEANFPKWKESYRNMPAKVRQFIPTPDGNRVWPSSFWMRKCA